MDGKRRGEDKAEGGMGEQRALDHEHMGDMCERGPRKETVGASYSPSR